MLQSVLKILAGLVMLAGVSTSYLFNGSSLEDPANQRTDFSPIKESPDNLFMGQGKGQLYNFSDIVGTGTNGPVFTDLDGIVSEEETSEMDTQYVNILIVDPDPDPEGEGKILWRVCENVPVEEISYEKGDILSFPYEGGLLLTSGNEILIGPVFSMDDPQYYSEICPTSPLDSGEAITFMNEYVVDQNGTPVGRTARFSNRMIFSDPQNPGVAIYAFCSDSGLLIHEADFIIMPSSN